jgi:hypothetical protein
MATEKRLIDANDLIERLKFKKKISEVGLHRGLQSAMSQCDKAPTVDAVEVVRCRDCYWWNKERAGLNGECVCNRFSVHKIIETFTTQDHFCACGERRKDG